MDEQLARGIANSLWPHLKLGRWRQSTRNLAAPTAGPGFRTAHVPAAPSMSQTIAIAEWVDALLLSDEWPGRTSYGVRLERHDYDEALSLLPTEVRVDFNTVRRSSLRRPFTLTPNRHGQLKLRRTAAEPLLTPLAALALERIAARATLRHVDELTVDDYLIGEADVQCLRAPVLA